MVNIKAKFWFLAYILFNTEKNPDRQLLKYCGDLFKLKRGCDHTVVRQQQRIVNIKSHS